MSIQSEINRIVNFRNLSFQAVRDKGVTVPTDAVIDDLPDYIDAITGGGVDGDNLAYGSSVAIVGSAIVDTAIVG